MDKTLENATPRDLRFLWLVRHERLHSNQLRALLEDCKFLLQTVKGTASHTLREANACADFLANEGQKQKSCGSPTTPAWNGVSADGRLLRSGRPSFLFFPFPMYRPMYRTLKEEVLFLSACSAPSPQWFGSSVRLRHFVEKYLDKTSEVTCHVVWEWSQNHHKCIHEHCQNERFESIYKKEPFKFK